MRDRPVLLWFRNNLRLGDNPALRAAAAAGPLLPIYILEEAPNDPWPMGAASQVWLHASLKALAAALEKKGLSLILRRGPAAKVLQDLARESGATSIFAPHLFTPNAVQAEASLTAALARQEIALHLFQDTLLFDPNQVQTKAETPFRVFTPFARACRARTFDPPLPIPTPLKAAAPVPSDRIEDWKLRPKAPDWSAPLMKDWHPGEVGAHQALKDFLNKSLEAYATQRDIPAIRGTSRLSPHLHFGEVSPRQIWQQVCQTLPAPPGADKFLNEILWREFSYHLLFHIPSLPEKPLQEKFARFPWRRAPADLAAWKKGQTGYPIVDAGMRQLWQTGWMHNRVRMIVGSFLVKHLLLPWQEGEAWFWNTLVDADLASNSASWQWIAGCGADAAPYFRIFNPILQSRKFDPNGAYIRAFVPELAALDTRFIHAPFEAPAEALTKAGIVLGKNYPKPLVSHPEARIRALAAFRKTGKT